jgi:hypothetical protein
MRRLVLALLGLIGSLALSGCSPFETFADEYRYRLTVEIDTPDGVKTGSSVIQVKTLPSSPIRTRVKGEAVAVDLGERGTMFALLRSESDSGWAGRVMLIMATGFSGASDTEDKLRALARDRSRRDVPRFFRRTRSSAYPMLVTFGDMADPTSVMKVDRDDLASTFGEGVSIRRITVQVTDDPVTTGIEERLGWLEGVAGAIKKIPVLDRPALGSELPLHAKITRMDFIQGKIK